jgi:uncharacterized membrane protein
MENLIYQIFIVFFIATLPVSELRGAIPIGIGIYKLNPLLVFLVALLGNIFPVILLLKFLGSVSDFLSRRSRMIKRCFDSIFRRTRQKHSRSFEIVGAACLVSFVAIPLPATGAWSGSLIAFVFGVPFKKAFFLIGLGLVISGIIVTTASVLGVEIFRFFN